MYQDWSLTFCTEVESNKRGSSHTRKSGRKRKHDVVPGIVYLQILVTRNSLWQVHPAIIWQSDTNYVKYWLTMQQGKAIGELVEHFFNRRKPQHGCLHVWIDICVKLDRLKVYVMIEDMDSSKWGSYLTVCQRTNKFEHQDVSLANLMFRIRECGICSTMND